jgi:hypothetical protein
MMKRFLEMKVDNTRVQQLATGEAVVDFLYPSES